MNSPHAVIGVLTSCGSIMRPTMVITRDAIPVIALFNMPPIRGISPRPPSMSSAMPSKACIVSLENRSFEIKLHTTSTKSRAMVIITDRPSIPATKAITPPTAVPKPAVEPSVAPAAPLNSPPKPADKIVMIAFIPTPTIVTIITNLSKAGASFCSLPEP